MNSVTKDKLKIVKQKRQQRKLLFKKYFGLNDDIVLNSIFGECYLFTDEVAAKKLNNLPRFPRIRGIFQPRKKVARELGWVNKINMPDESFYTDSTAFLKGTQSSNPHNDYSQYFVDTGQRPQNFIRDTGLKHRFEEYPKLRELIRLKDKFIADSGCPPMYLKTDLSAFKLNELNSKFDVIFVEPPLEEYNRMNGAVYDRYWSWSDIEKLEIEQIAAPRSFIWLWCGSGQGLNEGRKCLTKWGFRRCEDICWIKTNKTRPGHNNLEPGALFQRTKEHCLMGIKGTVRRSTDGDFIHANVDIDLIIEEEPEYGVKDKPVEIFHIIEHFCLGKRRLHLFGRDSTIRQGWLTVGSELTSSNFDNRIYSNFFAKDPSGHLVPFNEDVERLRPKSPPPRSKQGGGGGGSGGGGGGVNSGSGNSSQGNSLNMQLQQNSCNATNLLMNAFGDEKLKEISLNLSNQAATNASNLVSGLSNSALNDIARSLIAATSNNNSLNTANLTNNPQQILAAIINSNLLSHFVPQSTSTSSSNDNRHHHQHHSSNSRHQQRSTRAHTPTPGKYGPTPSLLPFPSPPSSPNNPDTNSSINPTDISNINPVLLLDFINKAVSNNNNNNNNNNTNIGYDHQSNNNNNNTSNHTSSFTTTGFNVPPNRHSHNNNSNNRSRHYNNNRR